VDALLVKLPPKGVRIVLDIETVRSLALALPEAEEYAHQGRPSFQLRRKIFLTLWPEERRAVLKLSLDEQSALCTLDPEAFVPVPGAWGQRGWTSVFLDRVEAELFGQALRSAWRGIAPKRLLRAVNASLLPTPRLVCDHAADRPFFQALPLCAG
jgi:hypothetical protein